MEDKAAFTPLRPGSLRTAANGDQAAQWTKVSSHPRDCDHQSPFCHLMSRIHGRQGGFYSFETRKLEDSGKWRPSSSMDQGVKSSKGLRSPIPFLSLDVKNSW